MPPPAGPVFTMDHRDHRTLFEASTSYTRVKFNETPRYLLPSAPSLEAAHSEENNQQFRLLAHRLHFKRRAHMLACSGSGQTEFLAHMMHSATPTASMTQVLPCNAAGHAQPQHRRTKWQNLKHGMSSMIPHEESQGNQFALIQTRRYARSNEQTHMMFSLTPHANVPEDSEVLPCDLVCHSSTSDRDGKGKAWIPIECNKEKSSSFGIFFPATRESMNETRSSSLGRGPVNTYKCEASTVGLRYTTEQNVSFRENLGHVCAWSVFLASSPLATRLVGMIVSENVGPFHVRRTARIVWWATGQSVASRTREHLPPFGGLRGPLLRHVEFWYPLWPFFTSRGRPTGLHDPKGC